MSSCVKRDSSRIVVKRRVRDDVAHGVERVARRARDEQRVPAATMRSAMAAIWAGVLPSRARLRGSPAGGGDGDRPARSQGPRTAPRAAHRECASAASLGVESTASRTSLEAGRGGRIRSCARLANGTQDNIIRILMSSLGLSRRMTPSETLILADVFLRPDHSRRLRLAPVLPRVPVHEEQGTESPSLPDARHAARRSRSSCRSTTRCTWPIG